MQTRLYDPTLSSVEVWETGLPRTAKIVSSTPLPGFKPLLPCFLAL